MQKVLTTIVLTFSIPNNFVDGRGFLTTAFGSIGGVGGGVGVGTSTSMTSTSLFATKSPSSSSSFNNSDNPRSHHHHHRQHNKNKSNNGILSPTARESAVIVEWEPVSELERRIEDGIHYEHEYYDPLLKYGSEEKRRSRNEWKEKQQKLKEEACHWNGWSRYCWNGNDEKNTRNVDGVFCGFTITKEERERLKSADPNE